ncbi:MAG: ATP-binding cassette domain-containing protein [Chitinispirillaceae bacterium]
MNISFEHLTYEYPGSGRFCLGPLNLSFDASGCTALVGSNGSGKTTLIRILLRQITGADGAYSIDSSAADIPPGDFLSRFGVGYAPEYPVLDEVLSGSENLEVVRELRGVSHDLFRERMELFRRYLFLDDWFELKPCSEYSQGMRKKVSLMVAFMSASRFLVLDEPTNGLDPASVYGVKQLVSVFRQEGTGTLVSSHVLDFVEKLADVVIILKRGDSLFCGTLDQLRDRWPGKALDEVYFSLFTGDSDGTRVVKNDK